MYEQREDETGYIFYINKKTGERQNDNPKLLDVMNVIREQHKYIKYVTYRCATKIWLLKQSFYSELYLFISTFLFIFRICKQV